MSNSNREYNVRHVVCFSNPVLGRFGLCSGNLSLPRVAHLLRVVQVSSLFGTKRANRAQAYDNDEVDLRPVTATERSGNVSGGGRKKNAEERSKNTEEREERSKNAEERRKNEEEKSWSV